MPKKKRSTKASPKPARKEGRIRLAIGQKGHGKTTRLQALLAEEAKTNPRLPVFIHDTRLGVDGAIGNHAACHWDNPQEFMSAPPEVRSMRSHAFGKCTPEDVAKLSWHLLQLKRGSIIVFDELDQFPSMLQPGWTTDKAGNRAPVSFGYHLCHYGRVGPVIILGSARQPQDIAKCWLSQADTIDFFRCSTRQLLSQIGQSGWPDAEMLVSRLPDMPKYRFVTVEK